MKHYTEEELKNLEKEYYKICTVTHKKECCVMCLGRYCEDKGY